MTDFDTAARQEAERRYPAATRTPGTADAFAAGARWGAEQADAALTKALGQRDAVAVTAERMTSYARRAEAVLREVAALHHHRTSDDGRTDWCDLCEDGPWPCATARVLARATQPGADR